LRKIVQVVVSGDLTQRARSSEFVEARRFLDQILLPKLVVPGNHDLPLYNLVDRLLRPLSNYNRYIGPVDQPAGFYNKDKLAVLGLNTSRRLTRKNGRISFEQMASIKQLFATVPADTFKAVVSHHPFAHSMGNAIIELAERSGPALEALASAGVKLLMSGHHHVASSGEWVDVTTRRSLLIVHAGTAVSTRLRGGERNSYNLLQISSNYVTVQVLEWSGSLRGFEIKRETRHTFPHLRGQSQSSEANPG
jgi:3',5'-cyclic AMP phosphodiesterase CpdA